MKWYAFLQAMNTTMLRGNKKPEVNFIIKNIFDKKMNVRHPVGVFISPWWDRFFYKIKLPCFHLLSIAKPKTVKLL